MKQPFAVIGITYLLSLIFGIFLGVSFSFYASVFFAVMFVISLCIKKLRSIKAFPIVFLVVSIGLFAYGTAYTSLVQPAVSSLDGKSCNITATVTDEPYERGKYTYYPVETISIEQENAPQNIKLLLASKEKINIGLYDNISCNVYFQKGRDNSYNTYSYSRGIYLMSYVRADSEITAEETQNKPFMYYPKMLNEYMSRTINKYLPDKQASLAEAILLGNKNNLDNNVKTAFTNSGVSHVVVVSGMHLSILVSFAYGVAYKIFRRRKLSAVLSIAVVLLYMTITGFSPSVVRAGIMMTLMMLSAILNRKSSSVNSLGLAALAVTIFNPLSAGDTGLLMSFAATFGIIILYPCLRRFMLRKIPLMKNKFLSKFVYYIISCVCISLSAVIMTFPISLVVFGTFNIYFVLSNLLITFLTPAALVCIMAVAVIGSVPVIDIAAYPFAFIARVICDYFIFVTDFISSLPFATINIDKPFMYAWTVITALIILFMLAKGRGKIKYKGITVAASLGSLLICFSISVFLTLNSMYIDILYTGGGLCMVVSENEKNAVIGCGGENVYKKDTVYKLESSNNINDLLIIPTGEKLSSSYCKDILKGFDYNNILVYDTSKCNKALKNKISESKNVHKFTSDYNVNLWSNVQLALLGDNDSLWIYILHNGKTILVAPENCNFNNLPDNMLTADVLIMSSCKDGLARVTAQNVILISGDSNHRDIYEILSERGINVISAMKGDVHLISSYSRGVEIWQE